MDFADLLRCARSIRRFREAEPVTRDDLLALVDLARLSPSGGNAQPLRYRLVADREAMDMFPFTAWAALFPSWGGPKPGERPTGYVLILAAADKPSPDTDVGIAAETLQLAATARGLGACMLGSLQREKIQELLRIPPEWEIRLAVAVGRPAETVALEEAVDGKTAYYRDAAGNHHVPKRPLTEVVIGPAGT